MKQALKAPGLTDMKYIRILQYISLHKFKEPTINLKLLMGVNRVQ